MHIREAVGKVGFTGQAKRRPSAKSKPEEIVIFISHFKKPLGFGIMSSCDAYCFQLRMTSMARHILFFSQVETLTVIVYLHTGLFATPLLN